MAETRLPRPRLRLRRKLNLCAGPQEELSALARTAESDAARQDDADLRPDAAQVQEQGHAHGPEPVTHYGRYARLFRRDRRQAPPRRRPRLRAATYFCAAVLGTVLLLATGLAVRMMLGPVAIEGLSQRVAGAMADKLGPAFKVTIGSAVIEHVGFNPALRLSDVEVRNPSGLRALRAPTAVVAVDPWNLVLGRFVPKSVAFSDLDLRLAMNSDGSLEFRAGQESDALKGLPDSGPAAHPEAPTPPGASPGLVSVITRAAASGVNLLTASDGILGGLDVASMDNTRLILVGPDGRERFRFDKASLQFTRPKDNLRHFAFGLTGPTSTWKIDGTVAGRSGAERMAGISFEGIAVDDILVLTGGAGGPVQTDMPLSGSMHAAVGTNGRLTKLDVNLTGGKAVIHTDDPDMPQFTMDQVRLVSSYDTAADSMRISELFATWDGSHVKAAGFLEPAEGDAPWRLRLESTDAVAAPAGPQDPPVVLSKVLLRATGVPGGGVVLEQGDVLSDKGHVSVTGQIGSEAVERGVELKVVGGNTDLRAAFAIWPSFSARGVRDYMAANFRGGMAESFSVTVDMNHTDILEARARRPLPESAVLTELKLSSAEYFVAEKLPLLRGAATGLITARTARIDLTNGSMTLPGGRVVSIPTGNVEIADSSVPVPTAVAQFRMTGAVEDIATMVGEAGMAQTPVDPATLKGSADLDVTLTLPVAKQLALNDVKATAKGNVANLSIDNVMGKDKLEGGAFSVLLDATAFHMKGDARIGGLPAAIEVRQPLHGGGVGQAIASIVLDDAARAKRGLSFGKAVSGPLTARITAPLARNTKDIRVELDLTKTRIGDLLPGWSKPAGKPGRVSFLFVDVPGTSVLIDDLSVDINGLIAKGTVTLNGTQEFTEARLSSFKLSPADDMRVDIDRQGQLYKVVVKGTLIDARPFLKKLTGNDGAAKDDDALDLDLDLNSPIVAGFNDEALTNVTLKLAHRGKTLRQLSMKGRFGRATASAQLTPQDGGVGILKVDSQDAGSLLRFADLYKRMSGGALALQVELRGNTQAGSVAIGSFSLRNEPALRRIVSAQPASDAKGNKINTDDVPFTGLEAKFSRTSSRITLRDGIIWGPQVGIKLDGTLDFARDDADLTGTFIPAYALNNAFSRIPLVGPILGGGTNEGVFAVSFRITGRASQPTLTVNPLTAVAPGIFRKFLEVFTPDGSSRRGLPAAARDTGG